MEPVTSESTCESCGAPITSTTGPCPYCGHLPVQRANPSVPAMGQSRAQPLEVGFFDRADLTGIQAADLTEIPAIEAGTIARGVQSGLRFGCLASIVGIVVATFCIGVLIWVFVTVIMRSAEPVFTGLAGDNPPAAAASDLAPLEAYMQAGAGKDAAAAGNLFMHGFGVTVPSQADLAAEFVQHPERYQGYQSARETGFVRVTSFGGNGDYWEVRAVLTYKDGPARVAYADMIQHSGWKLYQVTFPDVPAP
jgi:hypothetical protein